ncbi:centrosomal protein of 290 kDa-like [Rhopilema esculentum]|uniref:centrosomal protein of 290 kDa-like n=1 Tax=Rhopilema esculentum TaxID=499914 RepID=UPI0031D1C6F2
MAPLDWNVILSIESSSLQNDEDAAEKMFDILAQAEVQEENQEASSPQNMVQLFRVTQAVMMVKNVQYETALDELEQAMKGGGTKESDLMAEVEALQKELAHYQKYSNAGDKYLKSEMAQLEERNKLYEKELEELERKLVKEQQQRDKLSKQCEDLDLKNTELKREGDRLRNHIKDYQRQLESQRESQILRRGEDMTVKDQISKKNKEISGFIDEIRELQDENDRLQRDVTLAQKELKDATAAMNEMADDYAKLKSVLEDTDSLLENMRQERDLLRSQVQDLNEQRHLKTDADDEMMVAFSKKVDEWKMAVSYKDEEIVQLHERIAELQKQLQAARMDTDKNAMAELILSNQEKDEKINELKKSLEVASKDMQSITERIEETKQKAKDGGASMHQQMKIESLNQTLHKEQISTMKEREQAMKLERDIAEKDKDISELRARMMQYEMGQFGLPEAVQEIKEFRTKIKIRDKNIEDLTQSLNHVQMELDDCMLENEELRERLGLDPKEQLDADSIRKKKQVKEEQALALNRVLAKEVERLEEERQHLKKMLRKQAMHRGERAVELGLTTEDLVTVEDLVSQEEPVIKPISVKEVHADATQSFAYHKGREMLNPEEKSKLEKSKEKMKSNVTKLENENKELKDENKQLEVGLREILALVKDNRFKEDQNGPLDLRIPALEKLIAMIESRNAVGQYDTNLKLKAEIDQLNGRNEELRLELRNSRNEVNGLTTEIERKDQKMLEAEKEVELLKEAGQGIIKLSPFQLPQGMNPSSIDIIASLNEFLIQILQELSNKEEEFKTMEESLQSYKRKFSVTMHQQSILYSQYLEEKEQREVELQKFREENNSLSLVRDQDQIRIQEYERLLETLSRDPDRQKSRLSEYARKITLLRVNEKSLSRRYTILKESEEHVRKECSKLRNDITSVENAVVERIGYLTRYKEMASYRIAALQKALDESVPELELQLANKKYNELTAKYRDLLQKENILISRSTAVENLEYEKKFLEEAQATLRKQLHVEKERSYVLEQSMNDLLKKVGDTTGKSNIRQDEITSIARQLATLEMKELNERQRAEHAVRRREQLQSTVAELENRIEELEQKFAELTKINLDSQRVERELREELINAVPAEINRADKKRIGELEESAAKLRLEMSRLKEVAEIANDQAETVTSRQQAQEKELTSLRNQLLDIQMEGDEKTIIAKLHQHIVAQQISEATAVRKLEVTNAKVKRLEVAILRIEQQLDEKDQILYRTRMEARAKARFLQKTVQDLRRQFSGALPLIKQEKFAQTLRMLQDSKADQDVQLNLLRTKSQEAEGRSSELELKLVSLQDLIVTLKDGKGAEKVAEWHNRMAEIRLQDMKLRRQLEKNEQRIKYLEDQNKRLEESISLLEDENFKQSKEYEDRQLVWEQYEVELERKIARLEKNQDELFETAQKFEEATGSYVDPTLPIANQLEMAIVKLKEHIKTVVITRAEAKRLKANMQEWEQKLQDAEKKIVRKDQLINELRLRIPISERGILPQEVGTVSSEKSHEEQHAQNALQVAQSTVDSLKIMIKKKEETISKYQEMLKSLREDMKAQEESHKHEMKVIQDRLHLEIEEKVKKLKKMHLEYINAPQPPTPSERQLNRLAELEEMVAEQDNKLAVAKEQVKKGKDDIERLKEKSDVELRMQKKKIKMKEEEHKAEIEKLNKDIELEQNRVAELSKEIEILNDDLHAAKEANERAPTKTMKALVERLRNQLALKEKQQKALSQALLQLRRDMVNQAEENVQTHARKAEDELNVQKIVDKQTSSLESKIEELQARQEKLKTELKAKRESENAMKTELDQLKRDNGRKEASVKKLALELKEREELEDQVSSLKAEIRSLEKYKVEAEKLRKRIQVLEEEQQLEVQQADNAQTGAELDYFPEKENETAKDEPGKEQKSREEVIRWEENKKWQKRMESLKSKLKEKTEELEKAEKNIQMMKDIISRNDKEKASLQAKIKSSSRSAEDVQFSATGTSKEEVVQRLKGRIFQLEEENNDLQRRLALDRDNELHELRIRNSQLVENVRALEIELTDKQAGDDPDQYDWSLAREQNLQKEILSVRKENMELKFENDRARTNIPRLKARVKDLEEYCEILKSELETVKKREKERRGAMGTGMGGQSVEDMERVIAAMRRVIERLQGENDSLKKLKSKAPPHSDVARENRQLKQEIQKLRSKDGGSLSARGAAATKLVQENEKVRRDLKKCNEEIEKLRNSNSSLAIEKEKLSKDLEKVTQRLVAAEARAPKLEEADSAQWTAAVMTKMSEERVGKIEAELEKKNKLLDDLKNHLRSAAEREAELLRKEDEYKEKISLLERFPADIKADSDVVQHLQKARLRIQTLEAEKNELLDDVSRMRELTSDGTQPLKMDEDEILNKLKKYDRLLAIEVELRTQLRVAIVENEGLVAENVKLKRELEAFDPAFFEEIEDLKYNYKKSVERNVLYERQLKQLSRQFGVDVNIPDNDDY